MLKALIFDVDGTLAETEELHRIAFNDAFAEFGLDWWWSRDEYRELLGVSGGKERIRHYMQKNHLEHMFVDLDESIARLHARKTNIYTGLVAAGRAELRPGVRQLIDYAKANGLRLAIATTTSLPNVDALLDAAYGEAADSLFEVICAGDSVPAKKPAPDIYIDVLREMRLSAEDCLAIEDSRNGLLSANAAGIPTIVTPGIYTDDQDFTEATLVLPNLGGVDAGELIDMAIRLPQHAAAG